LQKWAGCVFLKGISVVSPFPPFLTLMLISFLLGCKRGSKTEQCIQICSLCTDFVTLILTRLTLHRRTNAIFCLGCTFLITLVLFHSSHFYPQLMFPIHSFNGVGGPVAEGGSFHLAATGLIPGVSTWCLRWGCRVVAEFI